MRWWVGIRIKPKGNSRDAQSHILSRFNSYPNEFDPPYVLSFTIKKLLGVTLLVALLLNGLINLFAARSLRRDSFQLAESWPEIGIEMKERTLILRRATEAAKIRVAKIESLGIELSDQRSDSE